jgi:biotin transport system substrate-specific component
MEAILRKEIILNKTLCRAIGVSVFVVLTCLGAFVRIPLPFTPVPLTLQTFFVLLSGASLGSLGALSQALYVLLGISGISIFSGAGSGLPYLFGPTGGYLFGFVLASLCVGRFIKYAKGNLFYTFIVFFTADIVLLFCGVIWLKLIFGQSFYRLALIGLVPFVPGDLIKALAASMLFVKLRPRLEKIF